MFSQVCGCKRLCCGGRGLSVRFSCIFVSLVDFCPFSFPLGVRCQGLAEAYDCGTPWTFLLHFMDTMPIYGKRFYLFCSSEQSGRD